MADLDLDGLAANDEQTVLDEDEESEKDCLSAASGSPARVNIVSVFGFLFELFGWF